MLGAKNGRKLRYSGLKGYTDYRKAVQIIKNGGYATSHNYEEKLCTIIEKWKLTQYDVGGSVKPDPEPAAKVPYLVRVKIPDLNIRKGHGTDTARTGQFTGVGIFTIVEVKSGAGSKTGWGRLKSGAGWISLDYCYRV